MIMSRWELFLVFATALVCIQLGFTNLILSVIVDAAAGARDEENAEKLLEQQLQEQEDILQFYETMRRIDTDGSGCISAEELMHGYDSDEQTKDRLLDLGLDKQDLMRLYELMDTEGMGEVSYVDFVNNVRKAEKADARMQFLMVSLHLNRIDVVMNRRMSDLENTINRIAWGTLGSEKSQLPENQALPVLQELKATAEMLAKSGINNGAAEQELKAVSSYLESAMAAVETDLRNLGIDLEGRLAALAHDAEVHRSEVSRHFAQMTSGLQANSKKDVSGGPNSSGNKHPIFNGGNGAVSRENTDGRMDGSPGEKIAERISGGPLVESIMSKERMKYDS